MRPTLKKEFICDLFEELSPNLQVEAVTTLYFMMSDAQKDKFLENIED